MTVRLAIPSFDSSMEGAPSWVRTAGVAGRLLVFIGQLLSETPERGVGIFRHPGEPYALLQHGPRSPGACDSAVAQTHAAMPGTLRLGTGPACGALGWQVG